MKLFAYVMLGGLLFKPACGRDLLGGIFSYLKAEIAAAGFHSVIIAGHT